MWLLKTETFMAMKSAKLAGFVPTDEERQTFAAAVREAYAPKEGERPRNMKVEGTRAEISVRGVLTETPDCFAQLFGGGNTTYASIREAVRQAEANPDVKEIVLLVDSPGGNVAGLFETLDVLASAKKPMRSTVVLAASAAYELVAVAGPIEARGVASEVGSIGVAARFYVEGDAVDITSTEAPNKRPDIQTDDGKAVVREELDEIHALFVDYIARGRARTTGDDEMSAAKVNADFGRGSVFLAKKAKSRGMVDSVPKPAAWAPRDKNATADSGGAATTEDTKSMTKEELKLKHPETFAAVREEGYKAGQSEERERCEAHLELGKSTGAMDVAIAAVSSGEGLTVKLQAKYMSAGLNKRDQSARQEDDKAAAEASDGAKGGAAPAASGKSPADIVADAVCGPAKEGK